MAVEHAGTRQTPRIARLFHEGEVPSSSDRRIAGSALTTSSTCAWAEAKAHLAGGIALMLAAMVVLRDARASTGRELDRHRLVVSRATTCTRCNARRTHHLTACARCATRAARES